MIQDTYGGRLDYPIEELMEMISDVTKIPFDSSKLFKAWLMTPGAMSEYYQEYTDINIYRKTSYSDIIDMKKYINLYTARMQRLLTMLENESPYRIAQYEGVLVVVDFLEYYYNK